MLTKVVAISVAPPLGLAVLRQPLDMKPDRLANLDLDGMHRRCRSDAAGQIRHIGRVVAIGLLDDDGEAHQH
jgi:hypothetical protein